MSPARNPHCPDSGGPESDSLKKGIKKTEFDPIRTERSEISVFPPPHRQELLKRYAPEIGTGTQNFLLPVPGIQLHQKFATASARKTGFAIRHQADQFVDRLLTRRNHGSQRIALRAHSKRAGAVDADPGINTPPDRHQCRRDAACFQKRRNRSGTAFRFRRRNQEFPVRQSLRPDRQDTGIRDAPPLSSNERSGSFCVPSLPIPPRPGRRGRPRPARRTEQTFRTIPPLRPAFPPHPAEDTIAEEDFPLSGTPGCSPGKTLSAPNRLQKRKKNQNAPVLPDSPAEMLFSASFPPYSPAFPPPFCCVSEAIYPHRRAKSREKKARPDRTGSGKLTSLRRFLCLCKRWNRLFSLLWRESDWSCSG